MSGKWCDPTEATHSTHHWYKDEQGRTLGYVVECKQYPTEFYARVGDNMLGKNQSQCVSLEYAKRFVEEGVLKMYADAASDPYEVDTP